MFSCGRQGPNEHGWLWERMLHNCCNQVGKAEAELRQAQVAAATRALHHHIGMEVGFCLFQPSVLLLCL